MAPAFTLTSSAGEQISLDDMGGKVVLLDFWATWCGPCKETLPEIQRVASKFTGQPLVVISISSDKDEAAWKTFVARNQMTWPQYRDADGALSRAYGVSSIPRFFTIDTDGALQSVKVGSGADVEGDVRKLLNKAHDAEKKRAKESDRATAGE
jgi:peroxiredoxin